MLWSTAPKGHEEQLVQLNFTQASARSNSSDIAFKTQSESWRKSHLLLMSSSPGRRIKLASLCQTQIRIRSFDPQNRCSNGVPASFMVACPSRLDMPVGHGFAEKNEPGFLSISFAVAKQVLIAVAARNTEKSGFSIFAKNLFFHPI